MADPYVGEIRMFGGNFAPVGWGWCNGQLLSISEYDILFNLIGTTYGGDGQSTFALPNLCGRIPIHMNPNYPIGAMGGTESVTLTSSQLPAHSHPFIATNSSANSGSPINAVPANTSASGAFLYFVDKPRAQLAGNSLAPAGGNNPHDNMQPFLCINFIISLYGIFPPPA
jgi:microcystin-dependent protein